MRTVMNGTKYLSRRDPFRLCAVSGVALLAAISLSAAAAAQQGAANAGTAAEPQGLPPANFTSSPHRGVIDGWGRVIPCRCRFNGKAYQLGEIVCMRTHVGTVLTRCDIFENNTSWIPSREACQPDAGT